MKKTVIVMIYMVVLSIMGFAKSHFIVVAEEENLSRVDSQIISCKAILHKEHLDTVDVQKSQFDNYTLIKVGPFDQSDALAVHFFKLKRYFPQAFILNNDSMNTVTVQNKVVKSPNPTVITKEVLVEKEDTTLWIALFGLAVIGVLYMFLSSDQIRRIKDAQVRMKEKYKALEEKQHQVLSSMGENIHTIAKETISQTNRLVEKSKETALHDDIKQVMHNEHELLGVTDDLIKFLRLKSKKVVVQNEVFNFNNVLNEVIGSLQESATQKKVELIFDIGRSVPQNIRADSAHIGQIIINLLEYYIQQSTDSRVYFSVELLSGITEKMRLQCRIIGSISLNDKKNLFEARYDEKNKKYIGLGLFVAKELIELMDGEILVHSEDGKDTLEITFPIQEASKEKRQYRLSKKEIMSKRILIVEKSQKEAEVLRDRFAYFKIDTTIAQAPYLMYTKAELYRYDLIVIDRGLLTPPVIDRLNEMYREADAPKIAVIENLYQSYQGKVGLWAACTIQKPFSPSYIFETLTELFDPAFKSNMTKQKGEGTGTLLVYRETFELESNMSLEKFNQFSGKGLLLVEDNLINQRVIEGVLSKSGMHIYTANNGEEALTILEEREKEIDLILMDINMPVMDGFVCTQSIREKECYAQIPIIALTALVAEHEISKMFDLGMNGYLSKPLKVEQLYTAMKMFLGEGHSMEPVDHRERDIPDSLPGLNIRAGMVNMQGNQVFYREVLKEFMDAYAQSDAALATYITEKRYGQARILCLDMKGLTETIGAEEMFEIVSEIHKYLTLYHHIDHADNYIEKYRETLEALKASIRIFLDG